MGFFKKLFGQWLHGQNAAYEPRPPSPQLAADTGDSSDNILERVRMGAAVIFGLDPPSELDIRAPLRTYALGLYQIDLVEIVEWVEAEFNISIDDDDWSHSSTPNW